MVEENHKAMQLNFVDLLDVTYNSDAYDRELRKKAESVLKMEFGVKEGEFTDATRMKETLSITTDKLANALKKWDPDQTWTVIPRQHAWPVATKTNTPTDQTFYWKSGLKSS